MAIEAQTRMRASALWLQPIVELVRQGNYAEANGLAEYFPATPISRLAQCVALLGQEKPESAEAVAKGIVENVHQIPRDVVQTLIPDKFNLLKASSPAIQKRQFSLRYVCLEAYLVGHSETLQLVISELLQLGLQALLDNNIEIGMRCLDRVIELDGSPTSRLRCAEVALAGRRPESLQLLSGRANDLIEQVLDHIPEEDTDNWLKVARLWAVDEVTLAKALELLRRILQQDPSSQAKVSSILLPLIEYKPYFQEIADFLIQVNPGNIAAICEGLMHAYEKSYEKSRKSALLEKARQLLDTEDCLAQTYYAEYARSVLTVAKVSGSYTAYARRLLERKVPPDVCLEMVQALIDTDLIEYTLVTQLLEQALEQHPSSRTTVIGYWARLYEQAHASSSLRAGFLARTIALSHGFEEFVQYGLRGDLARKLSTIAEVESLLSHASLYNESVAEGAVRLLIGTAQAVERRSAAQELVRSAHVIPLQKRVQWLMWLFATDMELSGENLQAVYAGLETFPPEQRKALRIQLLDLADKQYQRLAEQLDMLLAGEQIELARIVSHPLDEAIDRIQQQIHLETESPKPDRQLVELGETALRKLRTQKEVVARISHMHDRLLHAKAALTNQRYEIAHIANLLDQVRQDLWDVRNEVDSNEPHLAELDTTLRRFMGTAESTKVTLEMLVRQLHSLDLDRDFVYAHLRDTMSASAMIDGSVWDEVIVARSKTHSEIYGLLAESRKRLLNHTEKQETSRTTTERHTRVDFPSECILEHKVDLRIQLTREAPTQTRVDEILLLSFSSTEKQVVLDVHLTAPSFAIQQNHKTLTVPINDDSEEVNFALVPLEVGEQIVEVEFFHDGRRVGYLLVKTNVRRYSTAEGPSNVLLMEDPTSRLVYVSQEVISHDRHTIHVSWFEKEEKLFFTLYSSTLNETPEWEHPVPSTKKQIEDDLRELNAFFSEVITQGNPSEEEWESTCLNCRAVGESLFKILIPAPLADCSRKWTPGSSIIITTNEQWVPWELMHDGHDFWGRKFIVARYPRLNDRRTAPVTSRSQNSATRPIERIVNVVGGGLPDNEAKLAAKLFAKLPSSVEITLLQQQPIITLKKAIDGADVLHCTCHGLSDPHLLQIASDRTRTKNLLPNTVQELSLRPGSLVFTNACASTQPYIAFGKFGSFGWEFYRQGADVFIGTLGPVPTKYAIPFAEAVYDQLVGAKRQLTIGAALANARKEAADRRNLFWLLYCLYGDPDYSINIPQQP